MIEVYIDGASAGDPGPSGAGIYIKLDHGQTEAYSLPLGNLSNHEAEFIACIKALEICHEKRYINLSFRTDSQLIDDSINNAYIKNKKYQPYLAKILSLIEDAGLFFIKWIPSKQNQHADQLAREGIRKNL